MRSSLEQIFAALRLSWERLSERERRLLRLLGIAAAAFLVLLPFAMLQRTLWQLEDENAAIRQVLQLAADKQPELEQLAAKRRAASRRYDVKPPPLSSFIAEKGRQQGIELREFSDQPDKALPGYTREHVRVTMPDGIGLAGIIAVLSAIKNSGYPVAIERLKIEHFQSGDSYNQVEVDVASYERRRADSANRGGQP